MAPRPYPTRSYWDGYRGSRTYGGSRYGGSRSDGGWRSYSGGFRAPVRSYRPYYAFRPRVSLGFGLWAGFPIAYPYDADYDPYYEPYYEPYRSPSRYPTYGSPYPATSDPPVPPPAYPRSAYPPSAYPPSTYPPSAYPQSGYPQAEYPQAEYPQAEYPQVGYPEAGYPPSGSVGVPGPGQGIGGVSFEITPNTADVFVDGQHVGRADQFSPTAEPLDLTPGHHHIEIRAAGYRTMDFDADIVAGQVIPYQGTLQR